MAAEMFGRANEEFVNKNYSIREAFELYTEAIDTDGSRDDAYSNRANIHIILKQYKEALEDASKAIEINPKNVKAYLRKGTALFYLEQYSDAKKAFLQGQIQATVQKEADDDFKTWIRKCDAELNLSNQSNTAEDSTEVRVGTSSVGGSTDTTSQTDQPARVGTSSVDGNTNTTSQQTDQPAKPPAKSRYDWYQTHTHVVVTIMLKNVEKEDFSVDMQEHTLSVTVKLPGGGDYSLELDPLSYPIVPQQSSFKIMKSKIEIKLKKVEGVQWNKLEGEEPRKVKVTQVEDAAVHQYPSSSHYTRNWDKLVEEVKEEEKDEKKEGDAGLNELFENIYAGGTDETKKAMMKSFYESGGTVLSTNWNEVGKEKVEVKPPDGMEYRKWNS